MSASIVERAWPDAIVCKVIGLKGDYAKLEDDEGIVYLLPRSKFTGLWSDLQLKEPPRILVTKRGWDKSGAIALEAVNRETVQRQVFEILAEMADESG